MVLSSCILGSWSGRELRSETFGFTANDAEWCFGHGSRIDAGIFSLLSLLLSLSLSLSLCGTNIPLAWRGCVQICDDFHFDASGRCTESILGYQHCSALELIIIIIFILCVLLFFTYPREQKKKQIQIKNQKIKINITIMSLSFWLKIQHSLR